MKPVWMSSSLGKNIRSIARGKKESLILNPYCETGISTLWVWKDFGLKYAGESKEQQAQVVCAGDNLIHLSLLAAEQKKLRDGEVSAGNLYDSFYDSVRDKLQNADLAAVNQETIFVADHKRVSDYPRFGTPTEVGDAMVRAGFNLITLANNHALDQGVYGIDTTTAFWEEKGISFVGAQSTKSYSEEAQTAVNLWKSMGSALRLLHIPMGQTACRSRKAILIW